MEEKMRIQQLKVRNFKSIDSAVINFSPLTIMVGANASGKSNFINVLRFVSNIITDGIDNAVALQGGIPYLANASLSRKTPIEISFIADLSDEHWVRKSDARSYDLEVQRMHYSFSIQPNLRGSGYHIASDNLSLDFKCISTEKKDKLSPDLDVLITYSFDRRARKSDINYSCRIQNDKELDNDVRAKLKGDILARAFRKICNDNKRELMLSKISFLLHPVFSENNFIKIYDFDPRELKKASLMGSIRVLEEDGSNLASVLQEILRSKERRTKLKYILGAFLPFIESISIESNLDKSISYKVKESYTNREFHAYFLSDGTVSLIALIIALYFENPYIAILEEPERNIHPKLLERLLSSAEDVSVDRQIIITTHNPEFLKHAELEHIRLVSRDSKGFTLISEPSNSKAVKCFIENDLGIDDLFLQDLLGV